MTMGVNTTNQTTEVPPLPGLAAMTIKPSTPKATPTTMVAPPALPVGKKPKTTELPNSKLVKDSKGPSTGESVPHPLDIPQRDAPLPLQKDIPINVLPHPDMLEGQPKVLTASPTSTKTTTMGPTTTLSSSTATTKTPQVSTTATTTTITHRTTQSTTQEHTTTTTHPTTTSTATTTTTTKPTSSSSTTSPVLAETTVKITTQPKQKEISTTQKLSTSTPSSHTHPPAQPSPVHPNGSLHIINATTIGLVDLPSAVAAPTNPSSIVYPLLLVAVGGGVMVVIFLLHLRRQQISQQAAQPQNRKDVERNGGSYVILAADDKAPFPNGSTGIINGLPVYAKVDLSKKKKVPTATLR